jgi:hypothetical protein
VSDESSRAAEALIVISSQQRADELVRKVTAGEMDAERLAIAIAPLYGRDLQALARALVKAIGPSA